jgi:hypothetical protein
MPRSAHSDREFTTKIEQITARKPASQPHKNNPIIRKRPTRIQGRALEVLAHAIEYLVDSSLYSDTENTIEASQIMMRLNREVFAECA